MFSSRLGSRGALTESLFQSRGLRHHPDFRNTEGWKAVHKEQTIPYKHIIPRTFRFPPSTHPIISRWAWT